MIATSLQDRQETHSPHTLRADRALALFEERGSEIRKISEEAFDVPSCTGGRYYCVRYGGSVESCSCLDYQLHGGEFSCKHLLAVGAAHAARRSGVKEVRTIAVVSGDPFRAAGKRKSCSWCFGGYVTITVEEDGNEYEEAMPCRRCNR